VRRYGVGQIRGGKRVNRRAAESAEQTRRIIFEKKKISAIPLRTLRLCGYFLSAPTPIPKRRREKGEGRMEKLRWSSG
jgi:hypothetical protein